MLFSKTVWLRYHILLQQVSEFVSADFGANYPWFLALFVAANEHKENGKFILGITMVFNLLMWTIPQGILFC
jgi:hypothetical protein